MVLIRHSGTLPCLVGTPAPKYGLPSSSFRMSENQVEGTFNDRSYSELIPPGHDQPSMPNPHYKPIYAPPPCRFSPTKHSQHIPYAQEEPSECGGSDSLDQDISQYEPPTENIEFFVDGGMPGFIFAPLLCYVITSPVFMM